MTQHDPTLRMRHMLDHAKEAVDLLAGKEKAELSRNRVLELALVQRLERKRKLKAANELEARRRRQGTKDRARSSKLIGET